jgi:hypothetical protein
VSHFFFFFFLVRYDVTNKESFDNVSRWSQEVDHYLDVGTKGKDKEKKILFVL